jgi:hypothetical protein
VSEARIDGTQLTIQLPALDPEVCLRTEWNVIIFELIAVRFRTEFVFGVLLIPFVHASLNIRWRRTVYFIKHELHLAVHLMSFGQFAKMAEIGYPGSRYNTFQASTFWAYQVGIARA